MNAILAHSWSLLLFGFEGGLEHKGFGSCGRRMALLRFAGVCGSLGPLFEEEKRMVVMIVCVGDAQGMRRGCRCGEGGKGK